MNNEELTRKLDSLVFQIKLTTGIEDQETIKSIKSIILSAWKLGRVCGIEETQNKIMANLFKN